GSPCSLRAGSLAKTNGRGRRLPVSVSADGFRYRSTHPTGLPDCSAGVSPARSSDQKYEAGETPALQGCPVSSFSVPGFSGLSARMPMSFILLMEMPSRDTADQGAGKSNKSNDFHDYSLSVGIVK
ncbi:MAG: hypothetical protein Q7W53_17525, partial [Pseudomonadota bacterium]|nr:hypothetical protein [Pseudomonadota bacterium]